MKKVIVIGCPGAGKSYFSVQLCKKTGLPLIHLDNIWHKPDKTNISQEEFDRILQEFLSRDKWIIDGDYARTLELRFEKADTVFFLDYPTKICLEGLKERLGKKRADMPWVEYSLDEVLVNKVKEYAENQRKNVLQLIDKYKSAKNIIVFKSRDEATEYLHNKTERTL